MQTEAKIKKALKDRGNVPVNQAMDLIQDICDDGYTWDEFASLPLDTICSEIEDHYLDTKEND